MGLVDLGRALPVDRERGIGVVDIGDDVAFEQRHPVPGASERERGTQPADPAPDHDHVFGPHRTPVSATSVSSEARAGSGARQPVSAPPGSRRFGPRR